MSWARLLKRVYDIDIDHCPNCAGTLKIIAAIEDPPVIVGHGVGTGAGITIISISSVISETRRGSDRRDVLIGRIE